MYFGEFKKDETVHEYRETKITLDKHDFVYNRLIKDVCNYMNCKKQNINFIKQVLMTTICI